MNNCANDTANLTAAVRRSVCGTILGPAASAVDCGRCNGAHRCADEVGRSMALIASLRLIAVERGARRQ